MSKGRLLSTLVAAFVLLCAICPFAALAAVDAGVAADAGVADAGAAVITGPSDAGLTVDAAVLPDAGVGSSSPAAPTDIPDELGVVKDVAKAISTKDWFMLAGAILAAIIHLARYTLKKKWPKWGEGHYGIALAAMMAGVAALAVAWLTPGAETLSSHTAMGALKLLAAASLTYVVPRKLGWFPAPAVPPVAPAPPVA